MHIPWRKPLVQTGDIIVDASLLPVWLSILMHSDILEIVGSAILLGKPGFTLVEFTRGAAGALGRVGAVEVGDVTVPDVAEPTVKNQVNHV